VSSIIAKVRKEDFEEMSNLKPCPFCGGKAETRHPEAGFRCDNERFVVSCTDCNATRWNKTTSQKCQVGFDTEVEAIKAWNTRVENTCTIEYEEHDECLEKDCFHLSCDHVADSSIKPKYCMECGAKVVEE